MFPTIAPRRSQHTTTVMVCVLSLMLVAGCSQNPYLAVPGGGAWQAQTAQLSQGQLPAPVNPGDSRLAELNRRVQLLDDNNRQLHTQLAQSEQKVQVYEKQAQVYKDELDVVRQQLASATQQLESTTLAARQAQSQVRGMQASTQMRGGTSIQPNTNLSQLASRLRLNVPVRQDGEVIRIAIPSDQLFVPGSAQLSQNAALVLDPIAAQIRTIFPTQRIGIEGYTDNVGLGGPNAAASHQLASAQASAILDVMARRAGMPLQQFFIVAQGANRPTQPNTNAAGRAANRRIELVIYPQTY